MQYAQELDNAEVVTPFTAKLSVAQQARNGELRSHVCLAWSNVLSMKQEILSLTFCFVTEAQHTHSQT